MPFWWLLRGHTHRPNQAVWPWVKKKMQIFQKNGGHLWKWKMTHISGTVGISEHPKVPNTLFWAPWTKTSDKKSKIFFLQKRPPKTQKVQISLKQSSKSTFFRNGTTSRILFPTTFEGDLYTSSNILGDYNFRALRALLSSTCCGQGALWAPSCGPMAPC